MTHTRPGLACVVVLFWALGCVLPAVASAGEIIVRRDAGLSAGQRADVRAEAGVSYERAVALPHTELVSVSDAREAQALATLNADPDVLYAAPNATFRVAAAAYPPSDVWFRSQWDLEQNATTFGWNSRRDDADIDIKAAWNTMGDDPGSGVDVAVVDQVVHSEHPDLQGQISAIPGTDVVEHTGCTAPEPVIDHGTHVAGTIVAARNNGPSAAVGIAGIAPGARVVPVRAFDNCGDSTLEEILAAFRYAGEQAIPIVVASFSSNPLHPPDSTVGTAFARLFKDFDSTLFIVAAGNEGMDTSDTPVYPCDTPGLEGGDPANLICVGWTDREDRPDCQGNVGSSVDVYAPGTQIFSTIKTTKATYSWEARSGTSMAAAVVAGVAALALSTHPEAGGSVLREQLLAPDRLDFPPGVPAGRINAAKAVDAPLDPGDRGGGTGSPGGWVSCDQDHDGVTDSGDKCADAPGPSGDDGCPDTDADGTHDGTDNCRTRPNDQADMDGDGVGDACDPDVDGDTLAEALDQCPRVRAMTADGCPPPVIVDPPDEPGGPGTNPNPPIATPIPTPTPNPPSATPLAFTAFGARVTPSNCKAGPRCKKAAKLTVKLSRTATVAVRVERKQGKKWKRYTSRTLTVTTAGKSVTFRGKGGRSLEKGSYRIVATISGGPRNTTSFRVV